MKKLLLVLTLAIFAGLSFTSCDGKDEDGIPLIVGEWIPTKQEYITGDGERIDVTPESDCSSLKFTKDGAFELSDCGSWFISWATSSMKGNYTANGIFLTLKGSSPGDPDVHLSYSATSNALVITITQPGEFGMDYDITSVITTFKRK